MVRTKVIPTIFKLKWRCYINLPNISHKKICNVYIKMPTLWVTFTLKLSSSLQMQSWRGCGSHRRKYGTITPHHTSHIMLTLAHNTSWLCVQTGHHVVSLCTTLVATHQHTHRAVDQVVPALQYSWMSV